MRIRWDIKKEINQRYWGIAFVVFFVSYLLPVGQGVTRVIFYLLFFFPVLFSLRLSNLTCLSKSLSVWLMSSLCAYSMARSIDSRVFVETAQQTLMVFVLVVASLRLPPGNPATIKKTSFFIIVVLVFYIVLNALHQYEKNGWLLGQRLSPLFGQSKSVIFTADILVSFLLAYSWGCLRTGATRPLFLTHSIVIGIIGVFLQTRSVIPIWIISTTLLLIVESQYHARRIGMPIISIAAAGIGAYVLMEWSGLASALLARGDSYRFEIWSGFLAKTSQCGILTGCGWGSELKYLTANGTGISHPHSMYVQHFYWGGLLGLAILLATIALPMAKGFRSSSYATWPLLAGSIALAFDGKSLLSMPNERWFLVLVPLTILIGQTCRSKQPTFDQS